MFFPTYLTLFNYFLRYTYVLNLDFTILNRASMPEVDGGDDLPWSPVHKLFLLVI